MPVVPVSAIAVVREIVGGDKRLTLEGNKLLLQESYTGMQQSAGVIGACSIREFIITLSRCCRLSPDRQGVAAGGARAGLRWGC